MGSMQVNQYRPEHTERHIVLLYITLYIMTILMLIYAELYSFETKIISTVLSLKQEHERNVWLAWHCFKNILIFTIFLICTMQTQQFKVIFIYVFIFNIIIISRALNINNHGSFTHPVLFPSCSCVCFTELEVCYGWEKNGCKICVGCFSSNIYWLLWKKSCWSEMMWP